MATVTGTRPHRARALGAVARGTQSSAQSVDDSRPSDVTLERFRAGEEAAFDAVFRYYYPRLCQFVAQTFRVDLEDAEDVVQGAFVKIWRIRHRLPHDVSTPACLFQVTRTQALELLSKQSRRARLNHQRSVLTVQSTPVQPDEVAHHNLLIEQVRNAIANFPQRCRDAFWLRRVGGLSYAEIGHALGMEPRTAETHVREGHRRLREQLSAHELHT